ncbi:MAG TPA: FAD-binding oxidoreductase [Microlunatus sp.]|nr:FAD-binding oxidoreductase [Microlunatus sp.]
MTIDLTAGRPLTAAPLAAHTSALRSLTSCPVHLPTDPGYDDARLAWNRAVDQRPAAVAEPRNAHDVSRLVRLAAEHGLRVAPQTTGHNAGPLAQRGLDDVLVLKTAALSSVTIDPVRRVARVGGGTIWDPAVNAAAEYGLAALHGSSPDVGIAGYSLGGGIGWYARSLGLAANHVTAAEVVIGDGTIVRTDAAHDPELFWALRGGGGNFGVVTALEFSLFDIASAYAGMMIFDISRAEEVLRRWSAWAVDAPEQVTTAFRVLHLPPLPELPPFLSGRSVVVIDGAVLASDDRADRILADLRALKPEVDTFLRMPAPALTRLHMDPEGSGSGMSGAAMLRELPDAGIDAFLGAVADRSSTSVMMGELRQLGGALSRPRAGGGAVSHFDGQFLAFAGGMVLSADTALRVGADCAAFTGALAPWTGGRPYLNFVEDAVDTRAGFDRASWRQLVGIRSVVDPNGTFAANHQVPRLYEDGRPTC